MNRTAGHLPGNALRKGRLADLSGAEQTYDGETAERIEDGSFKLAPYHGDILQDRILICKNRSMVVEERKADHANPPD
jgi:hypothetical protein